MPRAIWSPLYLAAGDALVNRGGLLTFAHDFLREAVRNAYLPTDSSERSAHSALAKYFQSQQWVSVRQLDELPWQFQKAAAWLRLAHLLSQPGFLDTLWEKNSYELKAYWTQIETNSPLRMERVYGAVIQQPARHPDFAWRVGVLLADTGKLKAALRVRTCLTEYYRRQGKSEDLQNALDNEALTLRICGDLDGAMAMLKEGERVCRDTGNNNGLQRSLGNQAGILHTRGDLDGALALLEEQERICGESNYKDELQHRLSNKATLIADRGDVDGAMALYKEHERLCRELGNKNGLQRSLGNQATILYTRGDLDGAMELHKEEESICRELGNKDELQISLGNQAMILCARRDLDEAMVLYKEREHVCRGLGNPDGLCRSLAGQASILIGTPGRRGEAKKLADEALAIAIRHGFRQLVPQFQRIRNSI